jgi:hypothetical protein
MNEKMMMASTYIPKVLLLGKRKNHKYSENAFSPLQKHDPQECRAC